MPTQAFFQRRVNIPNNNADISIEEIARIIKTSVETAGLTPAQSENFTARVRERLEESFNIQPAQINVP